MKKATGSDIPRFTKDDEIILAKKHYNDQLTESTTFKDVYKNRLHTALVPLEEHVFERWHFKRIITIGDAAHKVRKTPEPTRPSSLVSMKKYLTHATQVHPYSAQGGNGALETAAVLLNTLQRKLDQSSKLSEGDIEAVFAEVQASRLDRAVGALEQGHRTSSLSSRDTLSSRLVVHFLFPWFGDRILMWLVVRHAEAGPAIERLPLPCRRGVTMPHAGTVTKTRGGKVPWRLGAVGAVFVAGLVCFNRSPGWPGHFATLLKGPTSLICETMQIG